jgi:hypothetical protein
MEGTPHCPCRVRRQLGQCRETSESRQGAFPASVASETTGYSTTEAPWLHYQKSEGALFGNDQSVHR